MKTRRQFLQAATTAIAATGFSSLYGNPLPKVNSDKPVNEITLGMAGYTFREFTVEQTIAIMKRIGVRAISLKDFHLPYNSSQEQINGITGQFRNTGIDVYALGVIYMKSNEFVDQVFEYARMAGVTMIVGAPDYTLLPYVEKKVKTYNIRMAIHNHGPDNPLYPNAADIWNHITDLDKRMGICIDIGHTTRDGQNPATDIEQYASRIFDVHIKDVDKPTKEGKTVEMGRGIINIPAVIASLRRIRYTGKCSLEFEKDMSDPLPGIAESIGYWKGASTAL